MTLHERGRGARCGLGVRWGQGSCCWEGWAASGSRVRACTGGSPPPTRLELGESSVRGKGRGPKTTNWNLSNWGDEPSVYHWLPGALAGRPRRLSLQVGGLLELGGGSEDISGSVPSSSNRLSQAHRANTRSFPTFPPAPGPARELQQNGWWQWVGRP